jgi:hypothetical protein
MKQKIITYLQKHPALADRPPLFRLVVIILFLLSLAVCLRYSSLF